MYDVFYSGVKPNCFPHEQQADNIERAQLLSRTEFFWWITYLSDYAEFDFLYVPKPWQSQYTHVWPSQHHEYSGTYLVPKSIDSIKYFFHKTVLPNKANLENFKTFFSCDFDYTWAPHPHDPPYIYVFGNQHWVSEKMPTIEYHVVGAKERKYMSSPVALLHEDRSLWTSYFDINTWDYSWNPDPDDPPYVYVWGNQHWPGEIMPTLLYTVPGATEIKYMPGPQPMLVNSKENWACYDSIDQESWDWSWRPSPKEPPYIYQFGTQHQKTGGPKYTVAGATEVKYVPFPKAIKKSIESECWTVPDGIDQRNFDFSWHPDENEPPYIYVFGTQHQKTGGPKYTVAGATEVKHVPFPRAIKKSIESACWTIRDNIDLSTFDFSWHPDEDEPPYIYVFGNQWNPPEFYASVEYCVPGATEVKYMDQRARRLPQPKLFKCNLPVVDFDYSWQPNPFDPPMTYVFGNQWNSAVLEPTVEYSTGGTEIKYVDDIIATVAQDRSFWIELDDVVDFDYSWRPNPTDPPYIYIFGNQWMTPEVRPALKYAIPGATEIKYMDHPRAQRKGDSTKFEKFYPCDFDWSWEPDPGSPPYIYVFGNQYYSAEVMPTVTFTVPGATERKYLDIAAKLLPCHTSHWHTLIECEWDYSWRPEPGSPPYIYVFGNQWWGAGKMPTLEYHMLGATERKYMNTPVAQLPADMTHWHVPDYVDVTDMDFSWVPDPGAPPYIYQFATQHQKTGGPQYRVPGAAEIKYVDMMQADVKREATPIFEIDHLDGNAGNIPGAVRRLRYFGNYRDTLIRLAKNLNGEYEYVWVCSSICDYSNFDFSWHPETWQSTMLHVFASDYQKFGDTFYMHVPTFAERAEKKQLLDWYSVNYVPRKSVPRRPIPVIHHTEDTHVDTVKNTDWAGPLALFTVDSVPATIPTVSLWRQETKNIVPLSAGAGAVIVPQGARADICTQLYDYPFIDKTEKKRHNDKPLDVVFVSNGESNAFGHWIRLIEFTRHLPNRVVRVDGVNGRVAAYHAAATASTTAWFFAIFAKLEVDYKFDWSWQPDRMQQPKHYIFHAKNPVNGLEYGHQAIIAYNKQLVLSNCGTGLDFTLDSSHEVVPVLSGVARYNDTPWMAWRTAFREVLKLKASLPDVESQYRLNKWLDNKNISGKNGEWSVRGAEDAVEYYDEVNGDFDALRKSYDWQWLASYALIRRRLAPDP
jgi:hypothetical protein